MAVGDHVVEMLHRRLAQAIDVVGRRRRKAALHDHAVPVAELGMAGRAVDAEALLPALQQRERHRRRLHRLVLIFHGAGGTLRGADSRRIGLLLRLRRSCRRSRRAATSAGEQQDRAPHAGISSISCGMKAVQNRAGVREPSRIVGADRDEPSVAHRLRACDSHSSIGS